MPEKAAVDSGSKGGTPQISGLLSRVRLAVLVHTAGPHRRAGLPPGRARAGAGADRVHAGVAATVCTLGLPGIDRGDVLAQGKPLLPRTFNRRWLLGQYARHTGSSTAPVTALRSVESTRGHSFSAVEWPMTSWELSPEFRTDDGRKRLHNGQYQTAQVLAHSQRHILDS